MKPIPLPPPPVPATLDLTELAEIPINLAALRECAATRSAEGFRAALLLWCACWHQRPAGSVPSDDAALASMAGLGDDLDAWAAVKAEALRGFVPRADGRHYHLKILPQVISADHELRPRRRIKVIYARHEKRRNRLSEAREKMRRMRIPGYAPDVEGAVEFSSIGPEGLVAGFLVESGDHAAAFEQAGIVGPVELRRDGGAAPPCPVDEVAALYAVTFPLHPPGILKARNELLARWREDKRRQSVAWWRGYFEHIRAHCAPLSCLRFRADLREMLLRGTVTLVCQGGAKKNPREVSPGGLVNPAGKRT